MNLQPVFFDAHEMSLFSKVFPYRRYQDYIDCLYKDEARYTKEHLLEVRASDNGVYVFGPEGDRTFRIICKSEAVEIGEIHAGNGMSFHLRPEIITRDPEVVEFLKSGDSFFAPFSIRQINDPIERARYNWLHDIHDGVIALSGRVTNLSKVFPGRTKECFSELPEQSTFDFSNL